MSMDILKLGKFGTINFGDYMKNNKKILKRSTLAIMVSVAASLPATYASASIFDPISGFFEDLGGDLAQSTGWIEDTGEVIAEETVNVVKISVNETGQFIDDLGNLVDDVSAAIYVDELFEISPVTGMPILKVPSETTEGVKKALLEGDWNTVALGLKDDAVQIGARAGATASEIETGLEDFGEDVGSAFEDAGEFIIDSEAIKQLGKGFEIIRGALTECLGSTEAVEYCYEQFVGQIIEFYNMMRHFVAKVTELKDYATGAMYDEIVGTIEEIEKKSIKYFMPVLTDNQDRLDFDNSGNPFGENSSVHEGFEQYSSIQDIRDSLNSTNYSYHSAPATACARVAIPVVCDDYESLNTDTINRFDFTDSSLSASELSERQQLFHALNIKAFGTTYRSSSNGSRSDSEKTVISDYLQTELFSDIDWNNNDQRIPYIVENEMLEGAGGAFIATDTDAILLLNEQLFADDNSLSQGFNSEDEQLAKAVALEEMGHWLNWRRCQYDSAMMNCAKTGDILGDPGLKFSDAAFIEYTDFADYISQLANVSEGAWSKPFQLSLVGGDVAIYEGNPGLADIQDALATVGSKLRFRMRTQLGVTDKVVSIVEVGSSGIIEVNYTPPKRVKAGDLSDMSKYGYNDADQALYLANIGVNFALENYIGAGSPVSLPILGLPIPTFQKLYFELGLKSTLGISFPLLKTSTSYYDGFTNVNNDYLADNVRLSYSVSPYAFMYESMFNSKFGTPVTLQLDTTQSIWAGVTTSWPANTATIPISITMAGITIASSGVGCVKGIVALSALGLPLSQSVQCLLGAQVASGTVVTGAGALFSLFNPNITFTPATGYVGGIRAKVSTSAGAVSAGVEVRFEILNSDWTMHD